MEFSPAYGHAMAVAVNFRKVDLNEVTRKQGKTSLLETLCASSDNSVLDQTMFIYPYEVTMGSSNTETRTDFKARSDIKRGDEVAGIKSLNLGNYRNGKYEKHGQLQLSPNDYSPAYVSDSTFIRTCNLFRTQPRQFEKEVLNATHTFRNWSGIFANAHMATGSSKQALKDFAKTLNLTHDPFENMAENISLEECHAVLRSVVQNETPLRFAMLEGNHRMECLVRLFYGVGFQEISVPRFGSTFEHHEMITKGSVMYKETHVRLCENPEANGLIYNSDLVRLREFSEHLTSKRKQLVQSSWGHLLIDCVTKVSQLPAWKAHLSSASVVWSEKVPTSVKLFSNTKWGEQQKQTAKWLLEYMLKVEPTVTDKALEPTSGGLSNFDASMAKYDMRVLFCPYTSLQNGTPDFNQAKRNLKIKCFKSIKPSVIMWLVQVFGSHKEAFKILQEFLQVPHGYMKDLDFLALYVCGPVNKITEMMLHATCTELEKQGLLKMKGKNLTKHATVDKQRLEHYIRVSYAISYLQTLTKLRMNWNFAPGSKNSILRTWMGKGDLGFDPSSKNML